MENDLQDTSERIRRFGVARIAEHWILVLIFSILLITGLSQKFYYLDISRTIITLLGGIDAVRLIHRYAGILFLIEAALHIAYAVSGILFRGWQPSMAITEKDLSDAIQNIKYYLGREHYPAQCDRYTYKQKFEYWGTLLGGLVMIATGLILWFPAFFIRFLPGEIIPAAKALHTNEALVIVLIIAVWHIYDSIFSPDVFPIDTTMFTGYLSRERMLREHPVELLRIEGNLTAEQQTKTADEKQGKEATEPFY